MSAVAERVMYDASFQSACQRYANSGGSSAAIAAAAIRVLEADPKLLAEFLAAVTAAAEPFLREYKGWSINFDHPPIPMRGNDWSATSPDYEVDCDEDGFTSSAARRFTLPPITNWSQRSTQPLRKATPPRL